MKDTTAYNEHVFLGKQAQMLQVSELVADRKFIPREIVNNEVSWFYGNLGIDDMYFQQESVQTIAAHILSLYSAKIDASVNNETTLDINLERATDSGALYIHSSRPGVSELDGPKHEQKIDKRYLDVSTVQSAYRLETFRSGGTVSSSLVTTLRCYFVHQCDFVTPNPTQEQSLEIRLVSDKYFLEKATPLTLDKYEGVMRHVLSRTGPVIELYSTPDNKEKRLVIGFKQRTTQSFFSAMSDLYHYYDLYTSRKYVENFSNGVTIYSFHLNQLSNSKSAPLEASIYQVIKEASLLYCMPTSPLQEFFQRGQLSVQEVTYGYVGWIFAQHFLNRLGSEFNSLSHIVDMNNLTHVEIISKIKKRFRSDTFTREYILDIIKLYPELIRLCYVNFAMTHYIDPAEGKLQPSISYQRIQSHTSLSNEDLLNTIRKTVQNNHEYMVI